jgi:hypothetical protein
MKAGKVYGQVQRVAFLFCVYGWHTKLALECINKLPGRFIPREKELKVLLLQNYFPVATFLNNLFAVSIRVTSCFLT